MRRDPRTWLEILGTDACWELVATTPVGRLGVAVNGRPELYPVNFAVDGRSIVFRTEAGSKLAALAGNPDVCFEVDAFDVDTHAAWSVLVRGRAAEVGDAAELGHLRTLPLELWSVGDKPRFVRITATEVTGRRIHPPEGPRSRPEGTEDAAAEGP